MVHWYRYPPPITRRAAGAHIYPTGSLVMLFEQRPRAGPLALDAALLTHARACTGFCLNAKAAAAATHSLLPGHLHPACCVDCLPPFSPGSKLLPAVCPLTSGLSLEDQRCREAWTTGRRRRNWRQWPSSVQLGTSPPVWLLTRARSRLPRCRRLLPSYQ